METVTRKNGHSSWSPAPATQEDELDLLDSKQVAELFKVPVTWVRGATRKRSKHPIPHVKVGRYTRFQEGAVRDWLNAQKKGYPKPKR